MLKRVVSTQNQRAGHSLLEVIAASALMAVALVPALRIIRDSFATSRDIETQELLITFATSKLEEHLGKAMADWQSGSYTGSFSAEGYSTLRYSVVCSDAEAGGGVTDYLMVVTATVWDDLDSSTTPDTGEPSVVFAGKVSQLPSYQDEV